MLQAMNLVDDRLNLFLIILDRTYHADGIVQTTDVGNFRRVEVIDTLAGRTIH